MSYFIFNFLIFQTIAVGNGNGSDLSMEIVQNNQIIYKLAFDDPGKNMLKPKSDSLKVIFDEQKKLTIVGDTKFRFHCSNGVNTLGFTVLSLTNKIITG